MEPVSAARAVRVGTECSVCSPPPQSQDSNFAVDHACFGDLNSAAIGKPLVFVCHGECVSFPASTFPLSPLSFDPVRMVLHDRPWAAPTTLPIPPLWGSD